MRRERAIDERIAELAARQGGVVSRRQLFGLGLSAAAIDHRVRRGALHLIHRGVYAVGHRLVNARGRNFAALLAVDRSALSFASAGAGWEVCEDRGPRVHLTVSADGGRRERAGLVIGAHPGGLARAAPQLAPDHAGTGARRGRRRAIDGALTAAYAVNAPLVSTLPPWDESGRRGSR
jgi:hypothetical protein